jgi:hypothetical protein
MKYLLLLPLAVQALAILVDEFWFHIRRGLPRWERIGHPLDTLTVLAPVLWMIFTQPTQRNVFILVCLAAFSCLFVTKDEFVHAEVCPPAEHWNHALLFVAHPLVFLALGLLWPLAHSTADRIAPSLQWLEHFRGMELALPVQGFILTLYMVYQAVYWNVFYRPRD